MVKLEKVNKYFFRRKKNEIHVINDTSLQLPANGLVALLGPSGCGKTTLLNVIGGLDKVDSGKVSVNGQQITGRPSWTVDKVRNLNVGYIFQNYYLVDNMTVFDNVAIALKMVGVKDKKEIEEKVNYVLEKVGMYRYRNRYADMLSGGERQRVGIARAIVKNPAVVIADEPTGNLDSKNTLEIMNIIKAISADKLVILVTHEEELAEFYASRIIRIKDGSVVSDEINEHDEGLDYRVDNNIYLKDIKEHKRLKSGNYNIDFYNDSDSVVNLDIVIRNGNIYVRTNNDNDRVEVVEENSSIELLDEHYRHITMEEARQDTNFDPEMLAHRDERKYRSIYNPFTLIRKGFRTVVNYNILKKILLLGFLISAMFITYSICNIFGVMNITDDEFVGVDKSYITVVSKKVSVDDYLTYEENENYKYVMPGNSRITLIMHLNDYFQTSLAEAYFEGSLSDSGKLSMSNVLYGRLPEEDNEILIDKVILDKVIEEQQTKTAGYGECEDFIDGEIKISNMDNLVIVGVTDMKSPCIYIDQSMFIDLLANTGGSVDETGYGEAPEASVDVINYELKKDDVELEDGDWPESDYEVLVNEKNKEDMKIGKTIGTKVNGQKLKVSGYYSDKHDSDMMLVNSNTVKYALIKSTANITICPEDKTAAIAELKAEGVNVKDTYEESSTEYRKQMWASIFSTLVMAGVILLISFIEIFLIIRASFLSRVKEVGVYRAIGVKKADIYKMFGGEILAISTIASLPGFLLTSYVVYKLSGMVYFSDMFLVNPLILAICLAVIYGLNLIFGLLPVFRIIRKTPAQILSRSDVN